MLGAPTTPTDSPNFGSFTLLAKLARGDIGDLFLARSCGAGGFEKLVIIKRIHAEFMRDKEISNLFHSEAQSAARIEHPNVRIIYEIGSNDEHHYIALEYLQGVPLVDLLLSRKRERRLADPRLIASLISQACQGLHAAHKLTRNGRPFVHGDINPRSIFVTDSGTTKLLDFDMVEMRSALAERHGFVRRTLAYMSPEEVRNEPCDRRSDIFSLGVVAWEAITGKRLFKQENREKTLAAIDKGRVPNAKDHQGGISDALNATIMRALSRDPSLRFQSAQDFGSAMDRAMLSEGQPLTPVAISTLIKTAFGPALEQQREFVRTARDTQDGEAHGDFEEADNFENPTVVLKKRPIELDEWSDDEPATTVGGEELLAAIKAMGGEPTDGLSSGVPIDTSATDPFKKISQNADFSAGHAPIWQDTRNLVLSELEADNISEADDDEKTGAVVLPKAEALGLDAYSFNTPGPMDTSVDEETNDQTLPGRKNEVRGESPIEPSRAPALEAPLVAKPESGTRQNQGTSSPGSIYDRRAAKRTELPDQVLPDQVLPDQVPVSVVGSPPAVSSPPPVEPIEVGAEPAQGARSGLLVPIIVGMAAAAAAGFFYISTNSGTTTPTVVSEPAAVASPSVVERRAPANSGPGAAAGILAAAGEGAARDAGAKEPPRSERPIDASAVDAPAVQTATPPTAVVKQPTVVKKLPKPATASAAKSQKSSRKTSKSTANTGSKGPGFLTIAASPYATVFVDGKKRGITPLVKLKLKPGVHRLRLVSSAGGKSKNMRVRITSGNVIRQNVRF